MENLLGNLRNLLIFRLIFYVLLIFLAFRVSVFINKTLSDIIPLKLKRFSAFLNLTFSTIESLIFSIIYLYISYSIGIPKEFDIIASIIILIVVGEVNYIWK